VRDPTSGESPRADPKEKGDKTMTDRRTRLLTFAAAALISLMLPALASAQQRPWWDRDDNNGRGDYGRNQPGRISDFDRRRLRELARRINDRARDFDRSVDRALDHSRLDGTRREDHINNDVQDFRRAAERFRDRAGEGNNINRSADEARQLLDAAAHVGTYINRLRFDGRVRSDWMQIRADLRTVADIYGFRLADFNDDYGHGRRDDDYGRGRRDDYGRRWPRN
jgi:hypothetical protein